jgi:hypothetical protein
MSANILPRDITKNMNLTVYSLNKVLESDACHKHRPQGTPAPVSLDKKEQDNSTAPPPPPPPSAQLAPVVDCSSQMSRRPHPGTALAAQHKDPSVRADYMRKRIQAALKSVPAEDKIRIATLITSALDTQERKSIRQKDLVEYVYEIMDPIISRGRKSGASSIVSSGGSQVSQFSGGARNGNPAGPSPSRHLNLNPFPPAMPEELGPTRQLVEGTALPPLPSMECR